MRKVLDLSQFTQEVMEVKVSEELSLNLQKPTQAIVIEMLKFRHVNEKSEPTEIMAALDAITLLIVNNNDKFVKYTQEQVDKILTTQQKILILEAYSEFALEIQSNPNS